MGGLRWVSALVAAADGLGDRSGSIAEADGAASGGVVGQHRRDHGGDVGAGDGVVSVCVGRDDVDLTGGLIEGEAARAEDRVGEATGAQVLVGGGFGLGVRKERIVFRHAVVGLRVEV